MPNYCANRLVIVPTNKTGNVKEFMATMNQTDPETKEVSEFSFDQTVPMPKDILRGPISMEDQARSKGGNWYDWSVQNWGTKWDAGEVKIDRCTPKRIEIHFDTAWSPPLAWLEQVSKKFKDLTFSLYYCDNGMPFHGTAVFKEGKLVKDDQHDHNAGTKVRGAFRKTHKLHAYA